LQAFKATSGIIDLSCQLQQQGRGTARDPSAALQNYLAAAKAGNFAALAGVRTSRAIEFKRLDEDFFSEDD
jgi:hypothetical protein